MIAISLAVAEPITCAARAGAAWDQRGDRSSRSELLGGKAARLLIDPECQPMPGTVAIGQTGWVRDTAMNAASWGMLGLFLGLGPGVVLAETARRSAWAWPADAAGWIDRRRAAQSSATRHR